MEKVEINKPIILKNKILLPQSIFEGSKIYEHGVEIKFRCSSCAIDNSFILDSNSGNLLDDLFLKRKLISKDEILRNHIAKESTKIYRHLGEVMIFPNLSALYLFLRCVNCDAIFMVTFSFGESQPGRNICYISGLWQIE
jgi:hypothetical protein